MGLRDRRLATVVRRCQELPGQELFEYEDEAGVIRGVGSADVNVIQDTADGVIMVARAKHSSAKQLRRAVEQLAPVRFLGMVLLDE